MISIQDSLKELETVYRVREGLLDCYLSAIKNCASYAIDFGDEITESHRKRLRALLDEISSGDVATAMESRSTLRGLLRDYRDKGSQYLATMRDELAGSARALEEIMDSLVQSDDDHETRLRGSVRQLHEIAASSECTRVAGSLRQAASFIEQSFEEMHKQHQVTVAQFQMEIGMLHKRIDSLESADSVDDLTRLFKRAEMEKRIRAETTGSYCLLLVSVRGLRRAEEQFGSGVAEELAGGFSKRLRNSLPPDAVISRWGLEQVVILIRTKKSEALATGKWITEHISGSYACLHCGKTVRPVLQLNVGVVDTSEGEGPDPVLERVNIFLTGE